ncbi:hypothetical protein DVR12_03075 [Chitinophaga silvatica]|uniref:HTH cro/C1-type domain-containing protein n=1 Tax=Chitinophaga silvatica TaxID=2282649 RepID=A0A3E1YH86_9BACT|nr:hypothetical protein [Chitinophaga silvatica]RFS26783.1 hypothetical protein DVR12_03075 [Chitinophaga silvatica]
MEKNKEFYTYRLGLGLTKWLDNNKKKAKENKLNGVEDLNLVKSEADLVASSGVAKNAVTLIKQGQRNPEYSTLEYIAEALGVPLSTFIHYCESISDEEVFEQLRKVTKRKR